MNEVNSTQNSTEQAVNHADCYAPVIYKRPWNYGKRKPINEDGILWCNCLNPKLISNGGGRGQALCMLCGYPWYH